MRQRTIVCPLIQNDGAYLLCKMADDRGVFPGQWALSGGGVEPGERIEEALRREIREELGEQLLLTEITPWTFSDDIRTKTYADGRKEEVVYLPSIFYPLKTRSRTEWSGRYYWNKDRNQGYQH